MCFWESLSLQEIRYYRRTNWNVWKTTHFLIKFFSKGIFIVCINRFASISCGHFHFSSVTLTNVHCQLPDHTENKQVFATAHHIGKFQIRRTTHILQGTHRTVGLEFFCFYRNFINFIFDSCMFWLLPEILLYFVIPHESKHKISFGTNLCSVLLAVNRGTSKATLAQNGCQR